MLQRNEQGKKARQYLIQLKKGTKKAGRKLNPVRYLFYKAENTAAYYNRVRLCFRWWT